MIRYSKFKYLYKIYLEDLNVDEEAQKHGVQYETVNSYVLLRCFRVLKTYLNSTDKALFIDIGCGAGRILHEASIRGFRHILGVELSEQLCKLCKENLNKFLPSRINFEIVNRNVKNINCQNLINNFEKQEKISSLVFFLNNPFSNDILKVLMDKIDELSSYDIYIIYVWKQYKETVLEKGFKVIHEDRRKNQFILDSFRIYYREKSLVGKSVQGKAEIENSVVSST